MALRSVLFLWPLALIAAACGEAPTVAVPIGPSCAALRDSALAASRCDDTLAGLAADIQRRPDESACASAARTMLASHEPQAARLRSVYEPDGSISDAPLSERERAELVGLERPAALAIAPDVGRVPGVPPTTASLEGLALESDASGNLSADVVSGRYTLRLRHAGHRADWCVQLRPCETLEVVAHGAHLARHPDVVAGVCGSTETAP